MPRRLALAVSLQLRGRSALVIGEGSGADERASRLGAAGAAVRQVAPAEYRTDMCDSVFLVAAQSGDQELDRRIALDARAAGALGYAHDQPEVSDFAFPALARRGPLTVAISTDGVAPALARRLREELERALDAAGPGLDSLLADLELARAEAPPSAERAGRLSRLAARLRLLGRFDIAS
jgi:siroheme synthase (precorrin-2 oxidase/ferrochelatase)